MNVQVEEVSSVARKLSITIPVDDVKKAFDKAFRQVGKSANIPGFRPGKAPRGILEKHYGERVKADVQEQLVQDTLYKAISEKELAPVALPQIDPGELSDDQEFSYTAEVEIQPEIKLTKVKDLPVTDVETGVEDKDIDEELDRMRKQSAQLVPVKIRDEVQDGDVVALDYKGYIDDVAFEGGEAENAMVEIGADGYIPGFAEGIVGAKVPGQIKVRVTFPEEYGAEHLAGKEAVFDMNLKEIKTKELPELDDDFAKDLGKDSLEDLKGELRAQMEEHKLNEAKGQQRDALLKALVEANPFDVPPSLIKSQADRMIVGAAQRMEQMTGQKMQLSAEELEDLRGSSMADAEQTVRSGLLLMELAKQEKLEVSDADLEAEIDSMAEKNGEHGERLKAFYRQAEQSQNLRYRLLEDRAIQFLIDNGSKEAQAKAES